MIFLAGACSIEAFETFPHLPQYKSGPITQLKEVVMKCVYSIDNDKQNL